jgi:hypothetical protein
MAARNPVQAAAGEALRAEIYAILERYDWREPLATLPPAKVILGQLQRCPLPSLRAVQWHITELHRAERNRLRMRNSLANVTNA